MLPIKFIVHPVFLALLSGLLLWLAWPVAGYPGLLFFAFVPLLLLEEWISKYVIKRRKLKFFGYTFLALGIWNTGTTWWVYNSTDVGAFFALGLNTLFMSLVWLLFHITKSRLG